MDYVKNIRLFSLLGQRGTYGTVLKELAAEDKKIVALSADLTRTSGLEQFSTAFPERFYNVGIAEENAVGMAAGLADGGYTPFVSTFANFATLRANEFVRHFMAYMRCNVKLVGFGAGFAMELFGNTHYGLEDISVIRSMPNITIFSPADGLEVAKIVEYASKHDGPVYIRLSGKMNMPIIHKQDFELIPGKNIRIKSGKDVAIFATGSMVNTALAVSKKLEDLGIEMAVFDVHTIKPFDSESVRESLSAKLIVTIEEHSITGGLGSSVAEELAFYASHGRLIRFGTGNNYKAAGDYDYMLEQHGLTPESIIKKIINELEKE